MLSAIRNKYKGWLAYVIVGFISIPFALLGVNQYLTGQTNIIVATIDDKEISKQDFLLIFNAERRLLQERLAENYDPAFDKVLRTSVINTIIDEELLKNFAKTLNFITTTSELQQDIQTNDLFKEDGFFSIDKYKQTLRLIGYSDVEYEAFRTNQLTQSQIKFNLLESAFVTNSYVEKINKLLNQERKFDYIKINANDYLSATTVDSESIENFYENKKDLFFEPQKISVYFIEVSLEDIAKNITINENILLDLYENEKNSLYTKEESREVQHILLQNEQTAQKVLDLINDGYKFSALAKEYSIDNTSKDNSGSLGFFTKGVISIPELENTIFNMAEGEISGLVASNFGYHIIRINKIEAAKIQTFEEVYQDVVDIHTKQQAQKNMLTTLQELANLAYELTLEEVAQQMTLTLQTSKYFTRDGDTYEPAFIRSAFSDIVLNDGENSPIIQLTPEHFVVLRLNENIAQRAKTFAESKDEIKDHLSLILARTFVDNIANDLVVLSINNEKQAIKNLMDTSKISWKKSHWIKRNAHVDYEDVIDKAFTIKKPTDQPTYSADNIDENIVAVIKLIAVKDPSELPDADFNALLLDFESNETILSVLKTLRAKANIKILENNL